MGFHKEYLDLILVPSGLVTMLGYHLLLLYRYLHLPHTTVIGFENNDKRAWVQRVMQGYDKNNRDKPISVIASNTSAATYLATISLTLSSLIGAWIANDATIFQGGFIFGDTRPATMTLKYVALLTCFLLAFSCFVQATRCFIHSTYLLSMPPAPAGGSGSVDLPVAYVEKVVIRGGEFWSLGLRALYFALTMLLWFFGPIPMFLSSIAMVLLLHYLDSNSTPLHRYGLDSTAKKPGLRVMEA